VTDAAAALPPVSRWQQATVVGVTRQTPRVISVFLQTSIPRHEAGQHVDVRLTAPDGYAAQRSYSIASAPGEVPLELVIEALPDGEVSPYFHDVAQRGDVIELRGPIGGHFVWQGGDRQPLLLVGGGSGVVPLMSILRHRARTGSNGRALLIYSTRSADEIIFRDELIALEARDASFGLVLAITRGVAPRVGDYERRIDASAMHDILARWQARPASTYVCGSNIFVEAATRALSAEGIDAASIRTERYGGTGVIVEGTSPASSNRV
jgi:ferredoxin-NADP reductase